MSSHHEPEGDPEQRFQPEEEKVNLKKKGLFLVYNAKLEKTSLSCDERVVFAKNEQYGFPKATRDIVPS